MLSVVVDGPVPVFLCIILLSQRAASLRPSDFSNAPAGGDK